MNIYHYYRSGALRQIDQYNYQLSCRSRPLAERLSAFLRSRYGARQCGAITQNTVSGITSSGEVEVLRYEVRIRCDRQLL